MTESYYTSLNKTETQSIMLESISSGPNVATTSEVLHPDDDAIFHIKDSDPKRDVKIARMVAYNTLNALLLGPFATRSLAIDAQTT